MDRELIVLLNADLSPKGVAGKADAHNHCTPMHLGFSLYLFNERGDVLLSRRSLSKGTWPGTWSNSCCGHPGPGEAIAEAATRRCREELGTEPLSLRLALADFRYECADSSGIRENEYCPTFLARFSGRMSPNPREVQEFAWTSWESLRAVASGAPFLLSPWCVAQVALLETEVKEFLFA